MESDVFTLVPMSVQDLKKMYSNIEEVLELIRKGVPNQSILKQLPGDGSSSSDSLWMQDALNKWQRNFDEIKTAIDQKDKIQINGIVDKIIKKLLALKPSTHWLTEEEFRTGMKTLLSSKMTMNSIDELKDQGKINYNNDIAIQVGNLISKPVKDLQNELKIVLQVEVEQRKTTENLTALAQTEQLNLTKLESEIKDLKDLIAKLIDCKTNVSQTPSIQPPPLVQNLPDNQDLSEISASGNSLDVAKNFVDFFPITNVPVIPPPIVPASPSPIAPVAPIIVPSVPVIIPPVVSTPIDPVVEFPPQEVILDSAELIKKVQRLGIGPRMEPFQVEAMMVPGMQKLNNDSLWKDYHEKRSLQQNPQEIKRILDIFVTGKIQQEIPQPIASSLYMSTEIPKVVGMYPKEQLGLAQLAVLYLYTAQNMGLRTGNGNALPLNFYKIQRSEVLIDQKKVPNLTTGIYVDSLFMDNAKIMLNITKEAKLMKDVYNSLSLADLVAPITNYGLRNLVTSTQTKFDTITRNPHTGSAILDLFMKSSTSNAQSAAYKYYGETALAMFYLLVPHDRTCLYCALRNIYTLGTFVRGDVKLEEAWLEDQYSKGVFGVTNFHSGPGTMHANSSSSSKFTAYGSFSDAKPKTLMLDQGSIYRKNLMSKDPTIGFLANLDLWVTGTTASLYKETKGIANHDTHANKIVSDICQKINKETDQRSGIFSTSSSNMYASLGMFIQVDDLINVFPQAMALITAQTMANCQIRISDLDQSVIGLYYTNQVKDLQRLIRNPSMELAILNGKVQFSDIGRLK